MNECVWRNVKVVVTFLYTFEHWKLLGQKIKDLKNKIIVN